MKTSKVVTRNGKTVYWGEEPCEGTYANKDHKPCGEKARYVITSGSIRCGIHSGKNALEKRQRKELIKNPKLQQNKDAAASHVAQAADGVARQRMSEAERNGTPLECIVIATPFDRGIGKEWSFQPTSGFAPIFPNNKHKHGFNYGFGDFSHCSPMKLGPVMHGQKGLTAATNVENYHQFNKVYPNEVLENTPCDCPRAAEWPHPKPSPEFYRAREMGYSDPVPHRHKPVGSDVVIVGDGKKRARPAKQKNAPLYSVHVTPSGVEKHFTYVESRYFYCHQMEELLLRGGGENSNSFRKLCRYRDTGYKIQLVGYDAYTPDALDKDTLYRHYCDPARPFGHELVILTLLCLPTGAAFNPDLPWNRYYMDHHAVYE